MANNPEVVEVHQGPLYENMVPLNSVGSSEPIVGVTAPVTVDGVPMITDTTRNVIEAVQAEQVNIGYLLNGEWHPGSSEL